MALVVTDEGTSRKTAVRQ